MMDMAQAKGVARVPGSPAQRRPRGIPNQAVDIAVQVGPRQRHNERTLWKAFAIFRDRCKTTARM